MLLVHKYILFAYNLHNIMHILQREPTGVTVCTGRFMYTNYVVQSQKAVSAYFTIKQILPFAFAEQNRSSILGGI